MYFDRMWHNLRLEKVFEFVLTSPPTTLTLQSLFEPHSPELRSGLNPNTDISGRRDYLDLPSLGANEHELQKTWTDLDSPKF